MEVVKPGHNMVLGRLRPLLAPPLHMGIFPILRTQPKDAAHLPVTVSHGSRLSIEFHVCQPLISFAVLTMLVLPS